MKMTLLPGRRQLAAILVGSALLFAAAARCQEADARATPSGKKTEAAFEMRKMIATGWPVLSVLLIMSIVSIAIGVERYVVIRHSERESASLFPVVMDAVNSGRGREEVLAKCDASNSIAGIVARTLREADDRESMSRVAQRLIQSKIKELETRISALGTIASTAPFVGLLGTVVGIIKAFQSIATQKGGGPEVVASGVAEALITTAFGLFVAIPAVVIYNQFGQRIGRLATEIDINTSELIEKLSRK
jgi:biopolymer transport protein ExbB/TolQ